MACSLGAVIQGDGLEVRLIKGFAHVESRVRLSVLLNFHCFWRPARRLLAVTFLKYRFLVDSIK